ncbi:hypothetical protein [Kaistia soli]|uniref:hypothetical protein n=1 Tax=Kaistia soli TaxID=446684 RepID=UPI0011147535|nr:hypothetical protein [Kaistia soli]
MADDQPLSDEDVHERLVRAAQLLGTAPGETTRGDTALTASRKALRLMQLGLLMAMEKADPTGR